MIAVAVAIRLRCVTVGSVGGAVSLAFGFARLCVLR